MRRENQLSKRMSAMGWLDKTFVALLLIVFGGVILHAPLSVALGTLLPDYDLLIKAWKEIMLGLAVVCLGVLIVSKRHQLSFRSPLFYAIGGYIALHIALSFLYFNGWQPLGAGLLIDLRYIVLFVLVYAAVSLYPRWSRWFLRIFIAGALVVGLFALLQATVLPHDILKYLGYNQATIMPFLTVDQNMDYVRINSTLRGPNPLGAYAVIVLALLAAFWLRARGKGISGRYVGLIAVLGLGSVVALWASYSRSALLAAVAALGLVVFVTIGRRLSKLTWVILIAVALAIAGSLVVARDTSFVSNVILHEDPSEGGLVNSNDGHVNSLVDGIDRMLHQPLGAGIGSTGSASLLGDSPVIIENQYLFVAHEAGWLGLGLFLAIFWLLLKALWKRRRDWLALGVFASGVGLALIGLLLPVWVDETVAIVWWGLAALALARPLPKIH